MIWQTQRIINELRHNNTSKNGKHTNWLLINNLGQTPHGMICVVIMIVLTFLPGNQGQTSTEPMDKVRIVWKKARGFILGNIHLLMANINLLLLTLGKNWHKKMHIFHQLIGYFYFVLSSPKRGPSRPFNFFGYLTSSTMDRLANALLKPSNHTFVVRRERKKNRVFWDWGNAYENDKILTFFFFFLLIFKLFQKKTYRWCGER